MLLTAIFLLSVAASAAVCGVADGFCGLNWIWILPLGFLAAFVLLLLLAFGFLWLICKLVDQNKPQENDSKFYRTMLHLYADAALCLARVRIKASGLEKTPKAGRFLLVCNHTDNIDPVFMLTCFRKSQLAFISKREVMGYFLAGEMMHKILCQPINRENDREALKTILKCIQILKEDKASIAVFPEGRIYPDKKLHHFRPGVFKIATKTKVPIVVCTLRGTPYVVNRFLHLKSSTVEVRLLQVIQPEEYQELTTVELSDRIYQIMALDLGPELVSTDEV
ncbi:MAG: 1-acyl-sn-glycerol-3-phosphate acyltransferase [Oscillospiraceae bacterium]|nr:1-acyl-sn-glycerol-3-phosphate acyltransferase [Oscillospiraceae bacterium]